VALAQKGISKAEYVIILAFAAFVVTSLMFLPTVLSPNTPYNPNNVNSNVNDLFCGYRYRPPKLEYRECKGCDGCDYSHGYWGYCQKGVPCGDPQECCSPGDCCTHMFWVLKDVPVTCDSTPTGAIVGAGSENVLTASGDGTCSTHLFWAPAEGSFDHYIIFFRTQEMVDNGDPPVQYMWDGQVLRTEADETYVAVNGLPTCTKIYFSVAAITADGRCGPLSPESDVWYRDCPNEPKDPHKPPPPAKSHIETTTNSNGDVTIEFTAYMPGYYWIEYTEDICPVNWRQIPPRIKVTGVPPPKKFPSVWPAGWAGQRTGFFRVGFEPL
jgi:hypothetical protein